MTTVDAGDSRVEPRISVPARQLADWLGGLVRNRDYGMLAELRRPDLRRNAHIQAGWFARSEEHRQVFAQVAFLFAVYHRGKARPDPGRGNLGKAARGIGGAAGRGPDDPGARRLMDRIVASRRPPKRHLQHAVTRLRSCDRRPPDWAELADDLCRWHNGDREVPYDWAVAFLRPHSGFHRRRNTDDTTTKGPEEQ